MLIPVLILLKCMQLLEKLICMYFYDLHAWSLQVNLNFPWGVLSKFYDLLTSITLASINKNPNPLKIAGLTVITYCNSVSYVMLGWAKITLQLRRCIFK